MGARDGFSKTHKIRPKSVEMPIFTAYGKFNHQTVQERAQATGCVHDYYAYE